MEINSLEPWIDEAGARWATWKRGPATGIRPGPPTSGPPAYSARWETFRPQRTPFRGLAAGTEGGRTFYLRSRFLTGLETRTKTWYVPCTGDTMMDSKLKYTFKTDTMFRMLFTRNPELLRRLVSALLGIGFESIESFEVVGADLAPDRMEDKFCRLDINMRVDGRQVNLEIQVRDEGDYPERTLFYWSRLYSSSLPAG